MMFYIITLKERTVLLLVFKQLFNIFIILGEYLHIISNDMIGQAVSPWIILVYIYIHVLVRK